MSALFSVKDKIILISGSTGVLGNQITQYLAKEGAQVIVLGRSPKKVDELVLQINTNGGKAYPLLADVTNEAALQSAKQQVEKDFGKIDVLINAAGGNMPGAIVTPDQKITDLQIDEVKKVMELNYLGTLMPIQVFTPLLLKNPEASIINISSMAASRPLTRVMGYASAKAAIDNLTKWLSVEFCQKYGKQYRVNAIAPGFFLTEQNRALLTKEDGSLTDRGNQIISHTPMDRFGNPEDLFGAVGFLCSDASKFVTGTIIPVDGGFSAYGGV
ncbi:SDR family oxidoreductase [Echinicola marina]|uniref:SDR family oxidoreductase n=1 Tax=Echinicola marina TaxID=2859768 RepID=UPI001CF637F5|nr:SDR family oxidoreductase [Echinicola marina]UCS92851.1 SDR family oxidoreductase [Echinicola marina]